MTLHVHLASQWELRGVVERGDIAVVIDVLRCSSTIATALHNGALGVVPVKTLDEAREIHRKNPNFILAGERGGVKPEGFQLGNSPREFTRAAVEGKYVILTTTDGTRALAGVSDARLVFVGSFLNAKTVVEASLREAERLEAGITLVAAGRMRGFSLEDHLCAGLLASRLVEAGAVPDDAAYAAILAYRQAEKDLLSHISRGIHAQGLKRLGLGEDVDYCVRVDVLPVLPVLEKNEDFPYGVIKPAKI